jgi:hypothetical protein
MRRIPVALVRPHGDGAVGCVSLRAFADRFVQQLLYRMILHLARVAEPESLGVAVIC